MLLHVTASMKQCFPGQVQTYEMSRQVPNAAIVLNKHDLR